MATQRRLLRQLYIPLRVVDAASARRSSAAIGDHRFDASRYEAHNEPLHQACASLSVGACLQVHHRLVVLGDPGGGKTTLLRWLATAYLLRHDLGPVFDSLTDTDTLPPASWLPVLIRCRDLGEADLSAALTMSSPPATDPIHHPAAQ